MADAVIKRAIIEGRKDISGQQQFSQSTLLHCHMNYLSSTKILQRNPFAVPSTEAKSSSKLFWLNIRMGRLQSQWDAHHVLIVKTVATS